MLSKTLRLQLFICLCEQKELQPLLQRTATNQMLGCDGCCSAGWWWTCGATEPKKHVIVFISHAVWEALVYFDNVWFQKSWKTFALALKYLQTFRRNRKKPHYEMQIDNMYKTKLRFSFAVKTDKVCGTTTTFTFTSLKELVSDDRLNQTLVLAMPPCVPDCVHVKVWGRGVWWQWVGP